MDLLWIKNLSWKQGAFEGYIRAANIGPFIAYNTKDVTSFLAIVFGKLLALGRK